jgi:hypothetical protein
MDFTIFTDSWWNWFVHEYAFTLGLLMSLLKGLAILHPGVDSNKIVDLLQGVFKKQ